MFVRIAHAWYMLRTLNRRVSSLARSRAKEAKGLERDRILNPDKYKRVHRYMRGIVTRAGSPRGHNPFRVSCLNRIEGTLLVLHEVFLFIVTGRLLQRRTEILCSVANVR